MMQTDAHLLIVDDDERIRTLLQKFLMRHGFLVSAARDAAHARRLLGGLDFDLIVLDVMMPGEDGIDGTDDRIRGLEAGADDYLAKPFEPKELLLRINAILRRMPQLDAAADDTPKVLNLGQVRYDVSWGELWSGDALFRIVAASGGGS